MGSPLSSRGKCPTPATQPLAPARTRRAALPAPAASHTAPSEPATRPGPVTTPSPVVRTLFEAVWGAGTSIEGAGQCRGVGAEVLGCPGVGFDSGESNQDSREGQDTIPLPPNVEKLAATESLLWSGEAT